MYPEIILEGTYNEDQRFLIDYDSELALAGIPPYYVHRERRKGDKMKNQRTLSELPIPEPHIVITYRGRFNKVYFADVVIAKTFEEAISFLGRYFSGHETEGRYVDDMKRFREERAKIDKDAKIAHEDEKTAIENEKVGQIKMIF